MLREAWSPTWILTHRGHLEYLLLLDCETKKKQNKTKQNKQLDLWELAEKPPSSRCIRININQAMETTLWMIEGALGDDVICCLPVCSAVAGWALG